MVLFNPAPAPPAEGPARGPWAASGPEELRDSERSYGCLRGAVTVCFQYIVLQVTVSDDSLCYSESAQLHSELGVAVRILPFGLRPRVLKQTARQLVSLVTITTQIVCESRMFSRQSTTLRSSWNSVQPLLESRYCIPSTLLNRFEAFVIAMLVQLR